MSTADPMARRPAGGADFLQLSPASAAPRGLTNWLVDELRAGISDGRLQAGTPLPATRVLADDLGVSRGVIVEAYQRLSEEGLVSALRGTGTRVLPLNLHQQRPGPRTTKSAGELRRPGMSAPPQLPQRWPAQVQTDLSPGVPDLSAFPRAAWLRAERAVMAYVSSAELGYDDPRGNERLRNELAAWLARARGLRISSEDIIVVAGVAQALALLAQRLRARAVTGIAVEDPGSRGARDELAYWGVEPVPIPVDGQGMQVDELVRSGLQAALLTPAHQFPTGVVLAPQRRRALLDWATAGGLVIEDDYDAEYRYDRAPVPALQASAPDHIAYAGSTSKTLAPGMRIGWLIPPRGLRDDLVAAKHASDLGSPAVPQLVLAQLIASGELERHIRLIRKRQRSRRDALLAELRNQLPQACVQGVAAGLHLLITFPELAGEADDTDIANRLRLAGVLVHPLSWHRERPGPPGLVLGYAAHPPDQLRRAAQLIARAVQAAR